MIRTETNEPLALKVLKLPNFIFKRLMNLYFSMLLFPSKLIFLIFEEYLINKKCTEMEYYRNNALQRGIISLIIFTLYIIPIFSGLILTLIWDFGSKRISEILRFDIEKIHKQFYYTVSWLLNKTPYFDFPSKLIKAIQEDIENNTFGDPTNLSFRTRAIIYFVMALTGLFLVQDHLKRSGITKFSLYGIDDSKLKENSTFLHWQPQKRLIATGILTVYFFEDLASIIMTIILFLTCFRYKHISKIKDNELNGYERKYFKHALKNLGLLLLHIIASIFLGIAYIVNTRIDKEYKNFKKDDEDFGYLVNCIYLGLVSILDVFYLALLFLFWLPISFLRIFSFGGLKKYVYQLNLVERFKFILRIFWLNFFIWGTLLLNFPFFNISLKIIKIIRKKNLREHENNGEKVLDKGYDLISKFWRNLILRLRLIKAGFTPNRLSYFCKYYCLALENGISIKEFDNSYSQARFFEEAEKKDDGDKEEMKENDDITEKKKSILEIEKEVEKKLNKIGFIFGLKIVINQLSDHMESSIELKENEKDTSICSKNFELLSKFLEEDLSKSFLMLLACVINPISGLQLIYFSIKANSNSYREINDLNDQISELFPLIFFDIIAVVIAPTTFLIALIFIHFKGNLNIFGVLFLSSEPKFGKKTIWNDMRDSNILFFKIWKLAIFSLYQCFNFFLYIVNFPLFLTSYDLNKRFLRFRKDHWFDMRSVRLVSRKMREICWKRLSGNFKLYWYKFEKKDHDIVDEVLRLIDLGFWNQRHSLWDSYDSQGEVDEKRLKEIEETEEESFDDKMLLRDLKNSGIELQDFELKTINGVYKRQAEFLVKYSLLKRVEKWMKRLIKLEEEEEIIKEIDPEELKGLTTKEEISAEKCFDLLKKRRIIASKHYIALKLKIIKLALTIISSTLLWRALDMKKFLNIHLVTNIDKEYNDSEGKTPSLTRTYITLYGICFKLLLRDILYYWAVFLILRVDKVCWGMCSKKIEELEFKKIPIFEKKEEEIKENDEGVGEEGKVNETVNPPEQVKVEEERKVIGYEEKPFLDSVANIRIYVSKRKVVIDQYAQYALNEQLEKTMSILGVIFPHRKDMISKIQTLKRIPQLQNIDSRTANVLIVLILLQDLLIFFVLLLSFLINPLRIYSFYKYVKSERFKNEINPNIDFNRFQNYNNIKAVAFKKARDFMSRTTSAIWFDLRFYFAGFIFCFFPLRLFNFIRLFLLIKLKLRNKSKGDDHEFNDLKFMEKVIERLRESMIEVKHDISSMFSIFVITIGVFEIKETWRRVKVLVKFAFKQTVAYSMLQRMKGMNFQEWLNFIGVWWLLGKVGISKEMIFGKEKEEELNEKRRAILVNIGWKNLIEFADYLTMEDKMTLCMVNKATRKFYMENSVLWLNYYKTNIQSNVLEIESFTDLSYACLAHYRKLIAEQNISTERDFNLGIRYILKEQAIKSIISFPDLIATPYKVVNTVCDKIGITYVSPNGFVTKQREDAQRYYDEEDRLRVDPRVRREGRRVLYCLPKYPATYVNHFSAATGGATQQMEEIPRIKGFLHLERIFYKAVLFLGGVNAYYRSLFFYKIDFENGKSFGPAILNFIKGILQITYCCSILYFAYLYIRFEMSLGCDLITAIIGPFCINLLIGFHLIKEVRINPNLEKEPLDPRTIGKCFGNFFYMIYRVTAYPVFRFIYLLLTKFLAKQLIPTIKHILKGTLEIYEGALRIPTEILLGKGTFFEILHLIVALTWVLWPQAFIWGFLSFETLQFLQVFRSTFGVLITGVKQGLDILNYSGWFSRMISYGFSKVIWIWGYIEAFIVFKWIGIAYSFVKKIWVLGWFIRAIETLIFGTFGFGRGIIMLIIQVIFSYGYEKFILGILLEKEETGGSMVPKVLLSLFILGFKILRAMSVIKDVQRRGRRNVEG